MKTAEETIASLENYGYRVLTDYKGLRAGRRVRNRGEQYLDAQQNGTAVIVAVLRNEGSAWEQNYRADDVEVVVTRDDGTVGQWASYGTHLSFVEQDRFVPASTTGSEL